QVPGFPRHDRRDARHVGRLARVRDGVHGFRRGCRQHEVDLLGLDEIVGHLRADRWGRLAIAVDDLHRVVGAPDGKTFLERVTGQLESVTVGLAEAGGRSTDRAYETDLDGARRRGARRGEAGFDQTRYGQTAEDDTCGLEHLASREARG